MRLTFVIRASNVLPVPSEHITIVRPMTATSHAPRYDLIADRALEPVKPLMERLVTAESVA